MNTENIIFIKNFLNKCTIHFNDFTELNNLLITRDCLLNMKYYDLIKEDIPRLKKIFSSSNMTALQQTATKNQKWPLLNLVRQVLKGLNYNLIPIRKSDGYDEDGKKKYKRFFKILKYNNNESTPTTQTME